MEKILWELHPIGRFSTFADTWDAINAQGSALPFLESGFIAPLYAAFGRGGERLALAHRGTLPVAALIIEPAGRFNWISAQRSQLPVCPLVAHCDEDLTELAQSLLAQLPGTALNLGLTELDSLFYPEPCDAPKSIQTLDYIQTAWVDVDTSFDAYWEARGKNLRANMRKQRNKLEAEGVKITLENICCEDKVEAAIAEYARLETASWKSELGTAIDPANAQGQFYAQMLKHFCRERRALIWQLKFDDKVVAMDLCIESHGTLVILKTTFDAQHQSLSPAFLMRQEAFNQVFDQARIKRIEFYGKVMEWHTRWTTHSRKLYHLNAYRWGFIPQLKHLFTRPAPLVTDQQTG